MATRNFNSDKSSLFADGSSNLGGGADQHLPVGGPYSGYTFRSAIRFALDYSGMKRIDSALLYLRTSSQVHVAFSSDPDIYVQRNTQDWTANGSSGSSDGGSGWGTSPTVYPGPNATGDGQVTKDVSTAQSTWISVDIAAIVRAWAPGSVIGGGGQPNYGVRLTMVASGDITEFDSYRSSSGKPYIVVTYATDTAPTATLTGPSGVQSTVRPTISGSASDPDGDAISNVGISVYRASDNVLVYYADIGAFGVFDHVPTADLPGGALWAVATPQAGGLTGAASNVVNFTVDRPPNAPVGLQPTGNISGNRRPLHQYSYSDPDGGVADLYDLEIYQSVGGAPSGAAVYAVTNQTAGIAAGSVQHTPTIDLPGGPLIARMRVRTPPAYLWSAWSAYLAYSIILTTPVVAWIEPIAPNAFEPLDPPGFVNPNANILTTAIWGRINDAPPSGQTLTREARGYGYDTAGAAWAYDGPPQAPNTPTGGIASQPIYVGPGGSTPYGRGHYRFIIGSSGGGLVDTQRNFRSSVLEWYGVVYLGDNVTALTATLAGMGGQVGGWIRAQAAKNVTSAPWRDLSDTAALIAELPKQGAYLGLKGRFALTAADVDNVFNGSFEYVTNGVPDGWRNSTPAPSGILYTQPDTTAPDGGTIAVIVGPTNGWMTAVNDGAVASQPVLPGATYTLSGWVRCEGSNAIPAAVNVHMYAPGTFAYMGKATTSLNWAAGEAWSVWRQKTALWTCPIGVGYVALEIMIAGAAGASEYKCFDAIKLVGPKAGAAGLDKWVVDWTSAG